MSGEGRELGSLGARELGSFGARNFAAAGDSPAHAKLRVIQGWG